MDLKIKDVSTLLHVSEEAIEKLIEQNNIPFYRLNDEFRFNRTEIENWVIEHSLDSSEDKLSHFLKSNDGKARGGTQPFSFFRAIHRGLVIRNVPGDTKQEIIKLAMQQIAQNLDLDAEGLTELLLDRETLMPTALNKGIAVPHTRDFLLSEAYDIVAIVYPDQPIEYGALDEEPVHTLFFLFACQDKRHLNLLAKIAHFCSAEENTRFLKKQPDKEDILQYIKEWESKLQQVRVVT